MLLSKYFGVGDNLCKLQSTALKEETFRIRSALGDSAMTYKKTKESPVHGTGP
jgi:hypothetical protein